MSREKLENHHSSQPSNGGRPSKLTPQVALQICNMIRMGNTYKVAAQLSGVCERTLRYWREKGEKAKSGKYYDFWVEIEKAIAESEALHVRQIATASTQSRIVLETRVREKADGTKETITISRELPPDWKASKFILMARWPERWNPNRTVELKAEDNKPRPIAIVNMPLDEI